MLTRRAFTASVLALALATTATTAVAQQRPIEVRVGETAEFTLPRQAMIIDSEDHSIATFELRPDGTAVVTGVAPGRTRIIGRDYAQMPFLYDVIVLPARR